MSYVLTTHVSTKNQTHKFPRIIEPIRLFYQKKPNSIGVIKQDWKHPNIENWVNKIECLKIVKN